MGAEVVQGLLRRRRRLRRLRRLRLPAPRALEAVLLPPHG